MLQFMTRIVMWAAFIVPTTLWAQEPPRTEAPDTTAPIRLEAIEVNITRGPLSLERTPAATSRVDARRLLSAGRGLTLDEALATVPGVVISDRNTFALDSRVSIRGFGARSAFGIRGVRILLDGIPLTMPDGQATLTNLDLGAAERIEVLRGPASALYGNAAGGVIAIESRQAPDAPLAAEARVMLGTEGRGGLGSFHKTQGRIAGELGAGHYIASLSHFELEGFREHARARQTHFTGRYRAPVGARGSLAVVLNAAEMPLAQNPGSLPLDDARQDPSRAWPGNVNTRAGKEARQFQAGLSYAHDFARGRIDASVYGLGREMLNPLPYAVIGVDRTGGGVRSVFRGVGTLFGREAGLALGFDAEFQSDGRLEHNNVGGRPGDGLRKAQRDRVVSGGPFAQGHIALHERIELTLGGRFDLVRFDTRDRFLEDGDDSGDRALRAFSPMAGLAFEPADGHRLYLTASTAFQTPTTTELINAPPAAGEGCCPGGFNNDLEPQRAVGYEVGARGRLGDRIRYEAAAFTMDVTGELVPFQVPGIDGRDFYRNAGRSSHKGVELGLAWSGEALDVDIAYAYSRFVVVEDGLDGRFDGLDLPGVPRHRLAANASYRTPFGLRFDVRTSYQGRVWADDANEASSRAYTLTDLHLHYERRLGPMGVQPFVGVRNVFDRAHMASVAVNAAGGRYYEPGSPRSLHIGLAVPMGAWAEALER